mmetsp:Transcript_17564/g.52865  ORF Transcript_17564/g.52865 Transcript_17564/m.52865 type:complete len:288 (+) Transcript_17564:1192-2055(+)
MVHVVHEAREHERELHVLLREGQPAASAEGVNAAGHRCAVQAVVVGHLAVGVLDHLQEVHQLWLVYLNELGESIQAHKADECQRPRGGVRDLEHVEVPLRQPARELPQLRGGVPRVPARDAARRAANAADGSRERQRLPHLTLRGRVLPLHHWQRWPRPARPSLASASVFTAATKLPLAAEGLHHARLLIEIRLEENGADRVVGGRRVEDAATPVAVLRSLVDLRLGEAGQRVLRGRAQSPATHFASVCQVCRFRRFAENALELGRGPVFSMRWQGGDLLRWQAEDL